jgi:acylphosphatase
MSDSEPRAISARVHGRVQGVGFRFFVQRQAAELGLKGWVRNLDGGGTVEVLAVGREEALDRMVEDLRRGPRMAFVERVDVQVVDVPDGIDGFEIRV